MRRLRSSVFLAEATPAGVSLDVENPALHEPTLYVAVVAQLDFALWNNTSADLTLLPSASSLEIYFPLDWFTAAQLQQMNVKLVDWTFAYSSDDGSLLLTYCGTGSGRWAAGTSIAFSVTNVVSDAAADAQNVQINLAGIASAPAQVQTTLTLMTPPVPGNAKLSDTLELSMDNQGLVYVSSANGELKDILPNSLILNLKNIGATPLYSGKTPWTGSPAVTVTFVYGSTSGSLAPDNDKSKPAVGSSWNIVAGVQVAQSQWGVTNPSNTGQAPHPAWSLYPVTTNVGILGTGDAANVTFDFSQVISFTPVGHTQMTLLFTGFRKDEKTAYDDEAFVLDIVKTNAPPTRGLLSLSSLDPVIKVPQANTPVGIDFRWIMFDVASIQLLCSYPGSEPYTKSYPVDAVPSTYPLGTDTHTVTIPSVTESTAVFVSVKSFDGLGGFLNNLQFTVFLNLQVFVDPRDGKSYPTMQVGSQLWLAANLDYAATGSVFYNDDPRYEATYGRLYTVAQAEGGLPTPWRVPTVDDWNRLIAAFGGPAAAYAALVAGGSSGFAAQLGGVFQGGSPAFVDMGAKGYYWTSTKRDSSSQWYAQFSAKSGTVTAGEAAFARTYGLSVRLVRDL